MKNNIKHPDLNMTKEQFIEWTTEGFPIYLENPEDFMVLFADYVNKSDNYFTAFLEESFEKVHINLHQNNLLSIAYREKDKKIVMLTEINEKNTESGYIGEFKTDLNEYELKKYLGEACMGVIVFCQGIKAVREESEIKKVSDQIKDIINDASNFNLPDEKLFSNNKKYDNVWPLK